MGEWRVDEDQVTRTAELDWRLHAPMIFKIITDCEYLTKHRGATFTMDSYGTIHRRGGWPYSPSEIRSFDAALDVLRANGCAFVHFDAICILKGESFQSILVEGRKLLARLFPAGGRYEVQT